LAKITLTDLASEDNVVSPINTAFDAIETAMENTLSRDGTSPNSMEADLDMNGNQILNLPAASAATDPVRKQELDALITVSLGINGGDVVGPAGATAATIAVFDGTTGKLLTDSTLKVGSDSIFNEDATSDLTISGGSTTLLGGRITLRGETHATEADDIVFLASGTEVGRWDDSATTWDMAGNSLSDVSSVLRASTTSTLGLSGGSTAVLGGHIDLYGESHGSKPGDIELSSSGTVRLMWDESSVRWDFQDRRVRGIQILELPASAVVESEETNSVIIITGGSNSTVGGQIRLYGESHATKPNDIEFLQGSSNLALHYDDSAGDWDFQNNDVNGIDDLVTDSIDTNMIVFGAPVEKTISSGAIDVTGVTYITIDTEADAATDTLDTINGGVDGQIVVARSTDASRDPTLSDNVGNLQLNSAGFTLSALQDSITLMYDATNSYWFEVTRSDNT
jgi:hypothetical protein